MKPDYSRLFGEQGEISRALSGFQSRPGQGAMAEAVWRALIDRGRLVVEAGTGTGKTLAYLLPALQSGLKVIISTGTKALQDQLHGKDLAVATRALKRTARVVMLKGRGNYLCLHRLEMTERDRRAHQTSHRRQVQELRNWAGRTDTGDFAEVGDTADGSPVWSWASSTTENCLGTQCGFFDQCFVFRARRAAQQADVVLVNHHLLFADIAVRESGFGELLPDADAVILDEAHQIPDVASLFFSSSLGIRQLTELARDLRVEAAAASADVAAVEQILGPLESAARRLQVSLLPLPERSALQDMLERTESQGPLHELEDGLAALESLLEPLAAHSKGLESCFGRVRSFISRLERITTRSGEVVRWVEKHPQGFTLHVTPLEIATRFADLLSGHTAAWVFTSATLTVGQSFSHYVKRLGIEAAEELRIDSPFDYRTNALVYLPAEMPDPNDPAYTQAVVERALPLLTSAQGGAFLLCTSHRAVQEAAGLLRARTQLPLLVQGEAGRAELLDRFRSAGNAVLIGTSSFWEGVDVRGQALRLVIIDRLPFAAPGDPVLKERLQAIQEQGGDPFMDFQLPQAVIALKQGAGRLIRDAHDRGVLMLCDPRLRSRGYGRIFLSSLPSMRQTREAGQACAFLEDLVAA